MNDSIARPVLLFSFVATSLLGVAFLMSVWLSTDAAAAIVRSSLFIVAMAAVHWIGFRAYVAQDEHAIVARRIDFSKIQPHLRTVLLAQLICLFLSSLLLDGGRGFRICVAATMAHWAAIAMVCWRDRAELTLLDVFVVRWGLLVALTIAVSVFATTF